MLTTSMIIDSKDICVLSFHAVTKFHVCDRQNEEGDGYYDPYEILHISILVMALRFGQECRDRVLGCAISLR